MRIVRGRWDSILVIRVRCVLLNPTLHAFFPVPKSRRPAWGSGNGLKSLGGGRCALWKAVPLDPSKHTRVSPGPGESLLATGCEAWLLAFLMSSEIRASVGPSLSVW